MCMAAQLFGLRSASMSVLAQPRPHTRRSAPRERREAVLLAQENAISARKGKKMAGFWQKSELPHALLTKDAPPRPIPLAPLRATSSPTSDSTSDSRGPKAARCTPAVSHSHHQGPSGHLPGSSRPVCNCKAHKHKVGSQVSPGDKREGARQLTFIFMGCSSCCRHLDVFTPLI